MHGVRTEFVSVTEFTGAGGGWGGVMGWNALTKKNPVGFF